MRFVRYDSCFVLGLLDGIVVLFKGKRLGVLGERAVGKTVRQRYSQAVDVVS
jgi:hypothetical protein